jgi:hypothetical protein
MIKNKDPKCFMCSQVLDGLKMVCFILKINANLVLMVKFCQPSHEFTFGVGMSFIYYPLVLTPLV